MLILNYFREILLNKRASVFHFFFFGKINERFSEKSMLFLSCRTTFGQKKFIFIFIFFFAFLAGFKPVCSSKCAVYQDGVGEGYNRFNTIRFCLPGKKINCF